MTFGDNCIVASGAGEAVGDGVTVGEGVAGANAVRAVSPGGRWLLKG